MRTVTLALGTLIVTLLAAGHVNAGRSWPADRTESIMTAAPAPASIPVPTSAPAGIEVLLLVR